MSNWVKVYVGDFCAPPIDLEEDIPLTIFFCPSVCLFIWYIIRSAYFHICLSEGAEQRKHQNVQKYPEMIMVESVF